MADAESRVAQALALLNDAWMDELMEYDTQGVNQAHRVLAGGEPPRAVDHKYPEGVPAES